MREDLPESLKGREEDIVAVLGCVVDDDADKGKGVQLPVPADYTLQSSGDNKQYFLFFDRSLPPAEAKLLGKAMKRATGADCADDISHVWRVPGSLNYPTASKISRGRDPTPFPVSVAMQWDFCSRTNVENLRELLAPHFETATATASTAVAVQGRYVADSVAKLMEFLNDQGEFIEYDPWTRAGMALRVELGDDEGFTIWWDYCCDQERVTLDEAEAKWKSFAAEHKPGGVITLKSLMWEAIHNHGWTGKLEKSLAGMFGSAIGKLPATGAPSIAPPLPIGSPGPSNASGPNGVMPMSMLDGQRALCGIAEPILSDFLKNTAAGRETPRTQGFPTLPEAAAGHGLYAPLKDCVARVVTMAETGPKLFKLDRESVIEPMAILKIVHSDTFEAVRRLIVSFGCELPDRKIKYAEVAMTDRVNRQFVSEDSWQRGLRNEIESDNPDNVEVLLGIVDCEVRLNLWYEKLEIRGGNDPLLAFRNWTYVDDSIVARLITRAKRSGTRFRPGKDFMWDTLITLGHRNPVDPVIDRMAELQSQWDGVPRLDGWLSKVCGLPIDPYYVAVGRNIIGGMVRRGRHAGCKHDAMAILFGREGSGKSTLAAILSLETDWFTDLVKLGDATKELILSLAGKLVVEISEMGMRGSANANDVKAMVSRQFDEGRTAYARSKTTRGRRNIFLGTTNEAEPLSDQNGNRRFLPVPCNSELDIAWLRANIVQVVGEAAALEASGDDFAIPREIWPLAAEKAEAVRSELPLEVRFSDWFGETDFTKIAYVHSSDLAELCEMTGLRGSYSAVMRRLGFRQEVVRLDKPTRMWLRAPKELKDTAADLIKAGAVRYSIGRDNGGRPLVRVTTRK